MGSLALYDQTVGVNRSNAEAIGLIEQLAKEVGKFLPHPINLAPNKLICDAIFHIT